MKHEKPDLKEEVAMLGRGILRTFKRDVVAAGIGALAGSILGLILSVFLGGNFEAYAKIGALLGVLIALLSRNTFSTLFEYDESKKREK